MRALRLSRNRSRNYPKPLMHKGGAPPDPEKRSPVIAGTMHGAGLEERGRATTFSYEISHKLAPASSFNRLGDAAAGATLTAGFGGSQ